MRPKNFQNKIILNGKEKIPQSGDMSDPFLYLLKFLYGGGGEKSAQKQM